MSSLFSRKTFVSFSLVLMIFAASGLLFSHLARADAWYDSSWGHRIKITVDHTKVGANLTNFPVYVDLSKLPASFFQDVRSDGGDIRITTSDGTTLVPREVVTIDTGSKTGELHFKAPSLSSSTDFGFYIYYDNPGATEPSASASYGSQNVWSNDYDAVFHLGEDPSGNAPQFYDSTGNGHDATTYGSMTASESVSGAVGNAVRFGSRDQYAYGDSNGLDAYDDFTISHYVKAKASENNADYTYWLSKYSTGGSGVRTWGFLTKKNDFTVILSYKNSADTAFSIPASTVLDNTWHKITLTRSGSTVSLYIDGGLHGTYSYSRTLYAGSQPLGIGTRSDYEVSNYSQYSQFKGEVDEIEIGPTARSADWVSTTYNNQSNPVSFFTISSPESDSGGGVTATTSQGVMHSTNYKIVRDSINIGGSEEGSSANYRIRDSVGQSAPGESASAGYNLHAGYRHMASSTASSSISISLASSSVTLSPSVSGISGGVGDATAQWTVTTDNSAGYTLEVAASSSPALQSDSSSFADYASASSTPDFNWAVAPSTSAFGFSPEGNDITTDFLDNGTICGAGANDTALRCWGGFSTTPATIAKSAVPTAPSGNTTTLHLRAEVGTAKLQESGNYTAVITATALAN